jgi:hypothetical protein
MAQGIRRHRAAAVEIGAAGDQVALWFKGQTGAIQPRIEQWRALPLGRGAASPEPFQTTCSRLARPTASCAPRMVPRAMALPGWLLTRIGPWVSGRPFGRRW